VDNSNQQPLVNWALGTLMAVLAWIVNLYRGKVDTLEKQHAAHAAQAVTRFELQKHMDDIRQEMSRDSDRMHDDSVRMHTENTEALHRIDDAVIRLHQRIDGNGSRPNSHRQE
jgi:hypothetical protein